MEDLVNDPLDNRENVMANTPSKRAWSAPS